MPTTICLSANTLYYPNGGGHLWAYLNWAQGFKANGCRIIWLEKIDKCTPNYQLEELVNTLKSKLQLYGLSEDIAFWYCNGSSVPEEKLFGCYDVNKAVEEADLLLNQYYAMPLEIVSKFRRSALLDIDPGLLQMWWHRKLINVAPHDLYFTIGETVGQPEARFSDVGVRWHYTPPCVSLADWPVATASEHAPFTTITHWYMNLWEEDNGMLYKNDKRDGYIPYFELPQYSYTPLELALLFGPGDEEDEEKLLKNGWRIRDSHSVAATPPDYQQYIRNSRGEFSCVKPSCVRLQNAWISDRTICYLASGKPCIVQHTGPSRFLPEAEGLFRFQDMKSAVGHLEEVTAHYEKHSGSARKLAETYFDAKKVTKSILERAL